MNISDSNEDKCVFEISDLIRFWSAHFCDKKCADQIRIRVGSDPDQIQNLKKYFKHVSSHQRHRKPFTIIAPPGDDKLNKSFVEPRNLKNCHSTPSMYRVIYWLELYTVIADQSRIRFGSDPKDFLKFQSSLFALETSEAIYNYRALGGWHCISIFYWSNKFLNLWSTSFGVQSHFFIEIVDWNQGLHPDFLTNSLVEYLLITLHFSYFQNIIIYIN